jgi:hypothetical protein
MHVDLPTTGEITRLLSVTGRPCVSIYLATTPETDDGAAERIAWKNSTAEAIARLTESGVEKRAIWEFERLFDDMVEDDSFWLYQANSLAVFTDGQSLRSYHLPNRLEPSVNVGDRFLIKPLLRAVTFPQACFVLAIAAGSVRLIEVGADFGPYDVDVDGMPADAASAAGKTSIADRSPSRRIQGSEGQKLRIEQYARAVDRALRPHLRSHGLPLILAAAEPMNAIYRGINTADNLAAESITGNPEAASDQELAAAAREILDRLYAGEARQLQELFNERDGQRRATTDLADLARAATYGMVDTLMVDIDAAVPGSIDDNGALLPDESGNDLVDEIARRVLGSSGRVMALRAGDIPRGSPAAAILRYSL